MSAFKTGPLTYFFQKFLSPFSVVHETSRVLFEAFKDNRSLLVCLDFINITLSSLKNLLYLQNSGESSNISFTCIVCFFVLVYLTSCFQAFPILNKKLNIPRGSDNMAAGVCSTSVAPWTSAEIETHTSKHARPMCPSSICVNLDFAENYKKCYCCIISTCLPLVNLSS